VAYLDKEYYIPYTGGNVMKVTTHKTLGTLLLTAALLLAWTSVSIAAERKSEKDSKTTSTITEGKKSTSALSDDRSTVKPAAVTTDSPSGPTDNPIDIPDAPDVPQQPAAGEVIDWQVLAGGGGMSSSADYILGGTLGQTAVGMAASSNYITYQGFWQDFETGSEECCIGSRGNVLLEPDCVASDQDVDIADLQMIIDHLFINFTPICCVDEADIGPPEAPDGSVDVLDLQIMIDHLFINFTPLPDCP